MTVVAKIVFYILALSVFSSFSWGVKKHFRSITMPRGMLILSIFSLVAFFIYSWEFLNLPFNATKATAAAFLHLSGGAVFFAAVSQTKRQRLSLAYDTDQPEFIITTGPYRLVRHPFYLSYILFWIGCTVATWSITMIAVTVAIVILYVIAARKEETKFVKSEMAGAYEAYCKKAGLFWPKIGKN